MKVRAIVTIPNMSEIFVKDDILDLEIIRHEKDVELYPEQTKLDKTSGKVVIISPAVVAKAGEFKSYVLVTADGRRYSEDCIHSHVGYKPLKQMFEKVNTESLVTLN